MNFENNPLFEHSVWCKQYKHPTKDNAIDDIQITASVIYQLHKFAEREYIRGDYIVDALVNQYGVSESSVWNILYILQKTQIISMRSLIYQNELANEIHEFSFTLKHKNEEINRPWHKS